MAAYWHHLESIVSCNCGIRCPLLAVGWDSFNKFELLLFFSFTISVGSMGSPVMEGGGKKKGQRYYYLVCQRFSKKLLLVSESRWYRILTVGKSRPNSQSSLNSIVRFQLLKWILKISKEILSWEIWKINTTTTNKKKSVFALRENLAGCVMDKVFSRFLAMLENSFYVIGISGWKIDAHHDSGAIDFFIFIRVVN